MTLKFNFQEFTVLFYASCLCDASNVLIITSFVTLAAFLTYCAQRWGLLCYTCGHSSKNIHSQTKVQKFKVKLTDMTLPVPGKLNGISEGRAAHLARERFPFAVVAPAGGNNLSTDSRRYSHGVRVQSPTCARWAGSGTGIFCHRGRRRGGPAMRRILSGRWFRLPHPAPPYLAAVGWKHRLKYTNGFHRSADLSQQPRVLLVWFKFRIRSRSQNLLLFTEVSLSPLNYYIYYTKCFNYSSLFKIFRRKPT